MGSNPCQLQERPLQGDTGPQSRRLPGSCAQQPRGGNVTHVEVDLCACSRGESSGKGCQEGRNRQSLSNVAEPLPCHRMVCFHFPARWWWHRPERCPKTSALRIRGSRLWPKLPDAHLKGVTSEKCKKKIPQTPLGASELKALNDHQENPWTRRGFGGRTITP